MAHLVVACGGVVDELLAIISTKMAWIFLRWTKRRCNGCKGSSVTHHARVTVQAGPEKPRAQKIHTHQQKKLSILSFPPLSPSSLHSFTCSSTLVITTTINHMISACLRANESKDYKKGALVRSTAHGGHLRPP